MAYKVPKYPRILVRPKTHKKLSLEAAKKGISIAELAEEKLNK
jgi:predicted HicB family RNase H-like nuclease